MQLRSSSTLTGRQGDSSVGASPTGFMLQWSLSPVSGQTSSVVDSAPSMDWVEDTPGAWFQHRIFIKTTSGVPLWDRSAFVRMVCHIILDRIPEQGLPEVCRSLADSYDFFRSEWRPSPAIREVSRAREGQSYDRPAFRLPVE